MLSQQKYVNSVLRKTETSECKTKSSPLQVNLKLSKDGNDSMENASIYAEVLGMLLYLSTCTRPDISYSVSRLARFMAKPRQEHWVFVKGVLQYLKKTAARALMYSGEEYKIEGYSDSGFAADPDKRRSTGGYVLMIAGGAICWASKLLPTMGVSTTETEYMAASWAAKEALWVRK
jgi:hypothetical protein